MDKRIINAVYLLGADSDEMRMFIKHALFTLAVVKHVPTEEMQKATRKAIDAGEITMEDAITPEEFGMLTASLSILTERPELAKKEGL